MEYPFRSLEVVTPPDVDAWLYDLLDFFKDQHLKYQGGEAEDDLLKQFIRTALHEFEKVARGYTVLETTYVEHKAGWGSCRSPMRLSKSPVQEVDAVRYYDEDDTLTTLYDDYAVDLTGNPALVWMTDGSHWATLNSYRPRPVQIEYVAGHAPEDVPEEVKTGIFLLATHFYRWRGDEESPVEIPPGFTRLATNYDTGGSI